MGVARQASEVSMSSTTANMADPGVIKPHVWQLAYQALNTFAQPVSGLACMPSPPLPVVWLSIVPLPCTQTGGQKPPSSSPAQKKSFFIEGDSDGEEETDGPVDSESDVDMFDLFGPARSSPPPAEGEEDVDAAIPL